MSNRGSIYWQPYQLQKGFILFVVTIVSTHFNCLAAVHWIYIMNMNPRHLNWFNSEEIRQVFFSESSNLLLLQRAVILDIFYDQAGASPGSCNSDSVLKQLFCKKIQILVQGASDKKKNHATVCARTQKYEYTFNIV